jgi:UDPglucose 6-dehydrogenase
MNEQREPIAVIGTGYVGLVTAAGFAEFGSDIWCVDVDQTKIDRLQRGEIPIYEPGLAESIERNRERFHFGTELGPALEHARLLFVAVGTPPTYSGDADLSAVNGARRDRRDDQADVRGARQVRVRVRLMPRVPEGGLGA